MLSSRLVARVCFCVLLMVSQVVGVAAVAGDGQSSGACMWTIMVYIQGRDELVSTYVEGNLNKIVNAMRQVPNVSGMVKVAVQWDKFCENENEAPKTRRYSVCSGGGCFRFLKRLSRMNIGEMLNKKLLTLSIGV